MLSEKNIVALCGRAILTQAKEMLKCARVDVVSRLEYFCDLSKPIQLEAIFMEGNIGYKRSFTCTIVEEDDELLINISKINSNIN